MSKLFSPWHLGKLTLPNRIVVAPMCQYSANDGHADDWHLLHLGNLALSGAGLLVLEATAVLPEGRVTPGDLGLYGDSQQAALARVLAAVRSAAPAAVAVQLGHAGRKASSQQPWLGGQQISPCADGGWQTFAASAVPHRPGELTPGALDAAGLARVREGFAQAAARAGALGIDGIEIHAAHGYLLHGFLSPLSNRRDDGYGGKLQQRMRFPLEVFDAVRGAFPAERPVWVRLSATDWAEDGWTIDDAIAFAQALEARGCAAIHVSSGGSSPAQRIDAVPGYQVPLAQRIRAATGMPVIAVGLITEPAQAETIVATGQADAVALGRAMLYNPRWPWHAAAALGAQVVAPPQYWRSQPAQHRHLFKGAQGGQR